VPHRSEALNTPTSPISPAATKNRADHPLRRGTGACAIFASRMLSRDGHYAFRSAGLSRAQSRGVSPALLSLEFAPFPARHHSSCPLATRHSPLTAHPSNRELRLLESSLTHRKQTVASHSNRELSTNPCCGTSHTFIPVPPFLIGSGSQTELAVTHSKQTAAHFLTGARTAISNFSLPHSSLPTRNLKNAAASDLSASYSIGYNARRMPTGSQGTQRAPINPPSSEFQNSIEELPVHSRLPRLDLGVDWESPWEEFRSSVRDFFHGPRAAVDGEAPQDSQLRVHWIEGRLPRRAFAASFVWHVIVVTILLLPIWSFLANAEPGLAMPRIELTYVPTQDLRPISLPGHQPKPSPTGDPAKPLPRSGADAFHPRQTILSQPLNITHPRQTLIQPNAPATPPKIVPQMPNIAEWAATSPQPAKPQLRISPSVVAPQVQHRAVSDATAPAVAVPERNAGPLDIAASPIANAQPRLPVNAMSKSVPERRNVHAEAGAAPVIGPATSPGDESLHRLIAISAAPAPPAPEVSVPQGNLSARVAISPEGTRTGAPGGSENGSGGNGGSGGTAASAGGAGTNSGASVNSGPAGVSISGGNSHAGSAGIGTAGNHSGGILLKPMPKIPPRPDPSHEEPIVLSKIDPSLPPEKILSGKEVFTLRVDMPNLTSASGSWILNFAQLDDNLPVYQRPKGKLSGPIPLRKVDPKYPQSAIKQRIDGEVILYAIIRKDGHVDSIQLVRGVDPLLDQNAMEALSRWEFRPATREGQPVDLEAVVHIPFHFKPPE
jgi:TonB family protein